MAARYVLAVFARKIFFENLLFLKVMSARTFFLGYTVSCVMVPQWFSPHKAKLTSILEK